MQIADPGFWGCAWTILRSFLERARLPAGPKERTDMMARLEPRPFKTVVCRGDMDATLACV